MLVQKINQKILHLDLFQIHLFFFSQSIIYLILEILNTMNRVNKLAPYCIYCIHYPAHKAPSNCDIYNAKGTCSLYKREVDAHATCDGGFYPADEDWDKYNCVK